MFKLGCASRVCFKNEILSGLTVALALVPEAVAFAFVAGVDPLVGLYAAFMVGLLAAIFGGRPGMISGATGAMAVVMVGLVAQHGVEYLFAAVVLTGLFQIGAGVLRLGKFIRIVPHPVMLGFVNGLAIVIFLAQLQHFQVTSPEGVKEWMTGEPLLLFAGLIAYTLFLIRQSRRENAAVQAEYAQEYPTGRLKSTQWLLNLILLLAGFGLLVVGSRWLVDGAVTLARQFGVSELIIGLTIVAAGTSLPEVATSVVASLRGERDIAVGNVVGSNLFNLMSVLGVTGLVAPHGISVPAAALQFDIPVMIAVAVACLPVFFTGHLIARWEGALFVGYYLAYVLYLVLAATGNGGLPLFAAAMRWFVIPLTLLTLVVVTLRALHRNSAASGTDT